MIDFLIDIFKIKQDKVALIWGENTFSYAWLIEKIKFWDDYFLAHGLKPGVRVSIKSEPSPVAIAAFLSLIGKKAIIAPLTTFMFQKSDEFHEIAEINYCLDIENENVYNLKSISNSIKNELLLSLIEKGNPGLILFSSGTTGKSKAALHDLSNLLNKYKTPRRDLSTIAFMHYDHIGGFDTLMYSLSNGSTLYISNDRTPAVICGVIEKYAIEVLPTTPSFLNLLILSEAYKFNDLSSLKYITYGAEIMPEATLIKSLEIFPNVKFLQKYGTTEVGTLRSKSKENNSLWVKIGGEGYQTRVVDGMLQIKAESAMLGYLNSPSPFTEDGWFITGDKVEVSGEYYKILGRESDIINVGGEKVYPAEVENVILELSEVKDVSVYGEPNPLLRNIVCANIVPVNSDFEAATLKKIIKKHCQNKLQNYKVPVKIYFTSAEQFTERFKKIRKSNV